MNPGIQGVAFDAYGTLFDVHSVIALSSPWRKTWSITSGLRS